jgi:hypothetical protein
MLNMTLAVDQGCKSLSHTSISGFRDLNVCVEFGTIFLEYPNVDLENLFWKTNIGFGRLNQIWMTKFRFMLLVSFPDDHIKKSRPYGSTLNILNFQKHADE